MREMAFPGRAVNLSAAREKLGQHRLREADIRGPHKKRPLPLRGGAERLVLNAMLRNQKHYAYWSIAMVA
jgi:hypothetical protein